MVRLMSSIGVAIQVPEPYGSELQRYRASFGDPLADAIPTHVTLLPPTSVAEDDLPDLEGHLEKVAVSHQVFAMQLGGTATFQPVSPVVFIAVREGISCCEMLADAIRSGPLERDLSFPYHPHVTVAHDLPEARLQAAFEALADYDCRFDVTSFSLYLHGPDRVWRRRRDFALA